MEDFEGMMKRLDEWNKQGWNSTQTHIGYSTFYLFESNYNDIEEWWVVCDNLHDFHKGFRNVGVCEKGTTDLAIWNLLTVCGHFWNAAEIVDQFDDKDNTVKE